METIFLQNVAYSETTSWLGQLIFTAAAVIVSAYLLTGVRVKGFGAAFILAIVLAILNATLGRFMDFLTAPLNWISFGLFSLIVDALIIMLAGKLMNDFQVDGFKWGFLMAIIVALTSSVLNYIF